MLQRKADNIHGQVRTRVSRHANSIVMQLYVWHPFETQIGLHQFLLCKTSMIRPPIHSKTTDFTLPFPPMMQIATRWSLGSRGDIFTCDRDHEQQGTLSVELQIPQISAYP